MAIHTAFLVPGGVAVQASAPSTFSQTKNKEVNPEKN